ncbi:kinetochore Sim4 complex subunit FTA2-domain-containing protein [Diaporthe sp. PMI_573]|nr:kinetochore Sim4 complex subunit FTA2-domain-containing protein [Diaporthaceae sp. PMI_573]
MSRYNLRRSQATRIIPLSLDGDRTGMPETDGYVFEVKIQSRVYALKVFKFFHPHSTKYYWGVYLGNSMPLKRVIYYTDPFFAECRAYSHKDMRMLEHIGLDLRTEVLDAKLRQALDRGGRVQAIMKDLAPSPTSINSRNVWVALSRVRKLNELQIYNRDIRADNFIGGKVVDFGSSWTEPHIILDALEPDDAEDSRLEDLVMFDDMIEEEKIKTRPKLQALHNVDVEHQKELKLRKKSKCRQTVKG